MTWEAQGKTGYKAHAVENGKTACGAPVNRHFEIRDFRGGPSWEQFVLTAADEHRLFAVCSTCVKRTGVKVP